MVKDMPPLFKTIIVIEIQFGELISEEDIIRYVDDYEREKNLRDCIETKI